MSEDMGCLVLIAVIIGLMFLFQGEPDVFDALVSATRRALVGCP